MDRRGAKAKIVIVDAARRNPFERRFRKAPAGLAAVSAPAGTLVMYAAAPGKVIRDGTGANSLFMGELIKELRVPNRTVGAIFSRTRIGVSRASNYEQVPWVASSLGEELYWGERPVATRQAPSPAPTTPGPATAGAPTSTPGEVVGQGFKPGEIFRDCPDCPELVVVPAGSFDMGSSRQYESPVHPVIIAKPFAIGRHEVTFDEWDKCADEGGCKHRPDDRQWGRGDRPVINVNWLDAKAFTVWLSRKTGQTYRLPSEAEWEYATRGGTETPYWWGRSVGSRHANCVQCNTGGPRRTSEVGSYEPNAFGLYDTAGNAAEWVEDCWNADYRGAPRNGSARETGQCRLRVLRGGAFDSSSRYLRSASRFRYDMDVRYVANGFRVLRELP
jgi:formylglycine-generating enzyme required for sulfatase activity